MGSVQRFNDIVNDKFQRNSSMSLSMKKVYGARKTPLTESQVDSSADCLVSMFGAPESKALYCEAVRYLEKWWLDEKAKYSLERGRNPAACFGAIVSRQLRKVKTTR